MKFRFLVVAVLCTSGFAADVQIVDQIVAKVNGDIIAQDELERTAHELRQELKAQAQQGGSSEVAEDEVAKREKDILARRIDQLLLVQKAKELNLNVDSDVTKYMTNLQRQAGISDPDKFHDYVRENSGMSYEDFLQQTKDEALTRQVIQEEVSRKVVITDKEIQDYYDAHQKDFIKDEKVFLSEILISTEGKDAAAAEKKAKLLSDEASRGERFSDLARDNSDAATAKAGGVLGGYKQGDLLKVFEDAVWKMPKGAVTKPIQIPAGWEILKVDDHTKSGLESLAEAKPEIENILYGPKMEPKVREYLTELRKAAFLQIKPGYVDVNAAPGQNTKWEEVAELKPETVTKAQVEDVKRKKHFLGVPVPFTSTTVSGKSSSR